MTDKTDNHQDHQNTTAGDNTKAEVISTPSATAAADSTAPEPQATPSEAKTPPPDANKTEKTSSSGKVLAIVAIIIAIVLAAILYWHGHNQALVQAEQLDQLQQKMQQQEQQLQSSLQKAESKQNKQLANVASRQDSLDEHIEGVSRKVLDLDNKRPNDWMLAEAEYLVRMAGRKLWLEQDAVAAAMMLANADERLAALNDPSLTPIRSALADDIASIKSVQKVDREGLVIKLNSINDQVDKLQLDGVIMARAEEPDFTVSDSVSDWKSNLKKSWASFSDNFVTVRRRDGNVEALLSPQQHWYLSENLKGKLLQAQLAVYREQQEIYDSSLAQSKQWLQDYFADDSVRQFMLEQLDTLSGQQIKVDYPEQFAAQESLKQLLDDRLQRLLTGQ
ncbi:heme biosynthesis operon protein HemX [Oceanisphaera marina]|uniref:Heme biosynthesis operon protein HemX n=1 Tax=Oceanisphaera marina TaxID=2017550 RepID=A0ABQ1IKV3_9GAMM|nr:uroporphyrinogen-III C-methyltransferase [Oceanisphaera marina]GGB43292.1 heme biosynthesis operon protein HemX [Oceanisphaera marina]